MIKREDTRAARARRRRRIRGRLSGTAERPRLAVFRSDRHIYAQLIDDVAGSTLAAASTLDAGMRPAMSELKKQEEARRVGELIAQRAKETGIETVVFDRGGFLYHGRIKHLAEAARAGGLKF